MVKEVNTIPFDNSDDTVDQITAALKAAEEGRVAKQLAESGINVEQLRSEVLESLEIVTDRISTNQKTISMLQNYRANSWTNGKF